MADKYYIILHSTINALAADTLGQLTPKKITTNILTSPRGSLGTTEKSLGNQTHNLWGTRFFSSAKRTNGINRL